jgi:tetratricopeptide (TPR) repeat protein
MALFPYKAAMQLSLLCASCTLFAAQNPTQEARFLKRMKEYWREGDFETAKKQIVAHLEEDPDSDLSEEMHLLLGDLYLKEGNFDSALEEYEKLTKEELQEKVYYNRVLCFYETDKVEELILISKTFSAQPNLSVDQRNSIRYLCASSLFESFVAADEKDLEILEQAKELFESCAGTSFESLSLYPLARVYEITGNKKQSASYYEAAAKFHPDLEVQFLFQSAILRSEVAPELAISTFEEIFASPSPKQSEALYNCLLLQYKMKNFKSLVATYEKNYHLLNEDQAKTVIQFYGKSLYQLGEFEQAVEPLLQTLEQSKDIAVQRAAQLMILECAYKMSNVDLYHRMFRNPSYPLVNDENYSKAHLVYLNLLKACNHYPEFIEESKMFILQNPDHPEKEQVLWDTAYFLYQAKNWKESNLLLSSFLEEFPNSKSCSNAWRLQLNCNLFQLQESPDSEISKYREALIQSIQKILPQENILSSSEKETFSFELIKNLFLEEQFEKTLAACKAHIEENEQTRFIGELELLQTLCYLSAPEQQDLFIEHAENLLKKSPNFSEADKLRLHLFNAYVQISEKSDAEDKSPALQKAADHLFIVFQKDGSSLKSENIQWLAEHYYTQASKLQSDPKAPKNLKASCLDKSILVFESLIPSESNLIQEETEAVLLRLSTLFTWSNQLEKKATLLARFLKNEPKKQSPIQRQLLLELAQTHEKLGDSLKALNLYNELIENYPASSIRALAVLDRSRLLSSYLPIDQQTEENETYAANLNDLKDLEVQRSLLSEPLHLEAGLEYIRWKSSLATTDAAQKEKKIQLLQLFKENFQSEFLADKGESADPKVIEKEELLVSYLKFAEAEILRLEASLKETAIDAETLQTTASKKIQELLLQTSLPESLKRRIAICQNEMETPL